MTNPLSRTLLEQQAARVFMVPCVVTSTSPLEVTLLDAVDVPGVGVAGVTYSLGAANALVVSGASPVVLPIA